MKNSRIAAIAVSIICLAALTPSISAATLDELFSYNILGSLQEKVDVERLKVTDVDNNGMMDILVVTTGKPGTPNTELKNSVYVFNKDGTIRWRYKIEREIFASIIKDVNNDRNMETVVSYGLMQENIPRGTIKILDKNGALINQYGRTSLMRAIHVDDLNNDKYYELLAGSESRLTLQFIDGSRIWDFPERTEKALNNTVYSISTIDLDRDDEKEIVYGSSGVYLLSRYGKFICGYEVDTELDPLKRYVSYLTSARLSADGNPEIIAATNTNKIYALAVKDIRVTSTTADEKTYTANLEKKWVYEFHNNINSIQMYDLDKDSYDEILVANENGNMYALDNTGRVLWTFRLDDAGKDFDITDIDQDGQVDIIVGASSGSIYSLDTKGNFMWKQATDTNLKKISAGDIDGDGFGEVALVTEEPKLYAFKINQSFIQKTQADNLYSTGERLFLASSYKESKEYLLQARHLYSSIGLDFEVRKTQSLLDRIESKISDERQQLAGTYYDKARDYYISGDYEKARKYVTMAKEIYTESGDSKNILKCELLEMRIGTMVFETTLPVSTTTLKNETAEGPAELNITAVILAALILIIVIAIILYLKKRREEEVFLASAESKSKGDINEK